MAEKENEMGRRKRKKEEEGEAKKKSDWGKEKKEGNVLMKVTTMV